MSDIKTEDCIKCGLCCYLGKKENFSGPVPDIVGKDGFCIHRSDKGCKIYENRWDVCKSLEMGGWACLEIRKRNGL